MRQPLSVFVITYNRAAMLDACLRAVSFADEVIVIDKSSTDGSAAVASRHADRVEIVPWSPTVEETRAYALSLCRHDWVLCLDDDEILSADTASWLRRVLPGTKADIFALPLRHYILGQHRPDAYYWPEHHPRLFRKGAIEYTATVHGGTVLKSDRIETVAPDLGVCIHHLSYVDVADYVARANRYTSRPDRVRAAPGDADLIAFAHRSIDTWMHRSSGTRRDGYVAAVALLRAVYDIIDRLKGWEDVHGIDGAAAFRDLCTRLTAPEDAAATTP